MKTLLQLNASLNSAEGVSSRLAARFVEQWKRQNADGRVIERDLAKDPVPHLSAERFGAFLAKPDARSPEQQAVAAFSDGLIDLDGNIPDLALHLANSLASRAAFIIHQRKPQPVLTGQLRCRYGNAEDIAQHQPRAEVQAQHVTELDEGSQGQLTGE